MSFRHATLALIALLCTLGARAEEFLPGVHRILFLGDSITHDGRYVADLETELTLRFPDRHFEIINAGLSSETVSGLSEPRHAGGKFPRPDLHERLERALAKTKPDLIFACYGMNDGIYLPLDDERFARFKDGITRLHDKAVAAGARIVHLTPPVFDPLPIAQKVAPADKADAGHPYEKYNDVLDACSDWLLSQRKDGWQVIDVHGPMKAALAARRKTDPHFSFTRDGVHPDAAGHLVMARAILAGLPVPIDIDAARDGDPLDPASRFAKVDKLVEQKVHVLGDAWLTEIGHKRPGVKHGLPLDEAKAKASQLDEQIRTLAAAPR